MPRHGPSLPEPPPDLGKMGEIYNTKANNWTTGDLQTKRKQEMSNYLCRFRQLVCLWEGKWLARMKTSSIGFSGVVQCVVEWESHLNLADQTVNRSWYNLFPSRLWICFTSCRFKALDTWNIFSSLTFSALRPGGKPRPWDSHLCVLMNRLSK